MVAYNITVSANAGNVRYTPPREQVGLPDVSWNLTYYDGSQPLGRTSLAGATVELDWLGTAAYLYGSAMTGSYQISVDGGSPEDGRPDSNSLLWKVEGLPYANHTVMLMATRGTAEAAFSRADLTLWVEDEASAFQLRNESATLPNSEQPGSVEQSPFFSYTPDGNWEFAEGPDRVSGNIPGQRMISHVTGDTLEFSLANASALFVHGTTHSLHHSLQVTVVPPEGEPTRTRIISDWTTEWDLDVLHHYETGLDRNQEYLVQIRNPGTERANLVDLRYLTIIDAAPSPSPSEPGVQPSSDKPQTPSSNSRKSSPQTIAGITVGIFAFVVMAPLLVAQFLKHRRRRSRLEIGRTSVHAFTDPHPNNTQQQTEVDAGPLPPTYDPQWEIAVMGQPAPNSRRKGARFTIGQGG